MDTIRRKLTAASARQRRFNLHLEKSAMRQWVKQMDVNDAQEEEEK